jgi:hypothetical protein
MVKWISMDCQPIANNEKWRGKEFFAELMLNFVEKSAWLLWSLNPVAGYQKP